MNCDDEHKTWKKHRAAVYACVYRLVNPKCAPNFGDDLVRPCLDNSELAQGDMIMIE